MIFNMNGGAGGGLDIKIVGGVTQPSNPKENTVWVNTSTAIKNVTFAPNAPASPVTGDVWVNTTNKYNSNGTNASTNLIRVNDNPYLEINVLNISQWDGSAWVTRDGSAIYANGAWTNMALYIFNYGSRGTYGIYYDHSSSGGTVLSKHDVEYRDDYLLFQNTSSHRYCVMFTDLIDITNYNILTAVLNASESRTVVIGLSNAADNALTYDNCINTGSLGGVSIDPTIKTATKDISAVTGKNRICIRFDKSGAGMSVYCRYLALTA